MKHVVLLLGGTSERQDPCGRGREPVFGRSQREEAPTISLIDGRRAGGARRGFGRRRARALQLASTWWSEDARSHNFSDNAEPTGECLSVSGCCW